ncbi:tetratricopeptide repeat protein [Chamaesiphon sp. OTE_75_metabat_556]|uniref:tetratricopeptide repeat protein n=1 Tax=Chamaesiphon sp. OTE_75_metabat_556 TaxID=2964692 RepID=UPI00286B8E39|nr:tetratricopeptide repeat protein [Chamaesiphon sp. OTE_75_metabat_556]
MNDPIEALCTVLLDIAKTSPGANINDVMTRLKSELDRNGALTNAIQTDARMLQINLGQSKGYQVLVEGNATAYIGDRYEFEAEAVIKALGQLLDDIALSQSPVGTPQNLPRSGVVEFVGRDSKLKELHEQLQNNRRIAIAAVQGMGGIGKTELALQYAIAQLQQGKYSAGLCWLRARDREIATDIVNFAQVHLGLKLPEQLEIDAQVAFCWQRWPEGAALVVLDDVTDYQAIEPYLPPADPRFKLLITTRLDLGSTVQKIAIEELDEDSAIALLESLVGTERIRSQLIDAQALCKWVGYLPLALELLGRFLARKLDWSIDRLLKALEAKRLDAKALVETENGMTGQLGVAAALELSWQELNEAEQELACVLGMFAIAPIPWSLVESCQSEVEPDDLEDTRDDGLMARSLLKRVGESRYQLHQIVQEYFRIKLEQRIDRGQILKSGFCQTMIGIAQNIKEPLAIDKAKEISVKIPHLEEIATQWINILSDDELSWPFLGIIRFYKSQRDYSLSESWCHRCLEIIEKRCSNRHHEVCYIFQELVDIYRNQGQYQEAEGICLQSLNIRIEIFGNTHTDVATSYNVLAGVYCDRGKYEEAELFYRKALNLMIKLLGESRSETLCVKNNLAKTLIIRGKYEEAELLLVQVIELIEGLLGKDSIDIINPMSNLAALYNNLGRYDEAEKLHKQVLDAKIENFGEHDLRVATTMNNLALVYSNQGKYKDALFLFEKSLKISKASLDVDHREIYTTIANIAKCHQDLGELTKARTLYIEALEGKKKILGEEHSEVATILNNLGKLSFDRERYDEAESFYLQSLQMRIKCLGDDHFDVAMTRWSLGVLYQHQKRYVEAKDLYRKAFAIAQSKLGSNNPTTQNILSWLNSLPHPSA